MAASLRGGVAAPSAVVSRQGQAAFKTTAANKGKGIVGAPRPKASRSKTDKAGPAKTPPPAEPTPAVTEAPPAAATAAPTAKPEVPPATKGSNYLIGAVLLGGVAASYFVTIDKMKGQDFLGDVEKEAEEEAQVNLHKSGLKVSAKVVPAAVADAAAVAASKVEDASEDVVESAKEAVAEAKEEVSEAVADLKEDIAAAAEEAPKKRKGWKKYILFGPRRGGE